MTKSKSATRSDLRKVDAHTVQPHEYDDAPELTDAQLAGATVSIGLRPRGRPKAEVTKEAISLRVDADVLAAFKANGPGWQSRMNTVLRAAVEGGKVKKPHLSKNLGKITVTPAEKRKRA